MALVWEPITDLPENWSALTDGELGPLLQFWNDQRSDVEQSGALAEFSTRLAREWSIEAGQIEGAYNIDRGTTQTLIERGIRSDLIPSQPNQKPPELVATIIQDHYHVLEGLFQFAKGDRELTKDYIHELQVALLAHQETTVVVDQFGKLFEARLLKGRYKERPNNPQRPDGATHYYCPPEQVDPEMERLLQMHREHAASGVPLEVEAAWLHHRFTQIHPYQDGNGRVARALASLIFAKAGWFPVVITRDDRTRYIDALEMADQGDLRSLVAFFTDVQKRSLFQATQAAADTHPVKTVTEAIAAAKKVLTGAGTSLDPRVWLKAKRIADRLMELAGERMTQVTEMLRAEIGENRPEFKFHTLSGTTTPFSPPKLGYTPNTDDYQQVRELSISTQRGRIIEVHAHAIGSKFRGLIGIVTFYWSGSGSELASKAPFQVNYVESFENAERRFRPWLEQSLVNALTLWRKSL